MDRDGFLSYIKSGNLSLNIATRLLVEYCVTEHNKDVNMTNIFIQLLITTGQLQPYIEEVIEYYKKKFAICEVIRLRDNQVLYMY